MLAVMSDWHFNSLLKCAYFALQLKKEVDHVEGYDVPSNRPCVQRREPTMIVPDENKKYEEIIVRVTMREQRRPI